MQKLNEYRLGRTGLQVTRLVFGSLPLGPLQANLTPEAGGELIRYAVERGVNVIDTAELYGTYAHIREGLKGFAHPVHVISKTHAGTAADARRHVERALSEMELAKLDVVHLHGAKLATPFVDRAEVLAELKKMRQEGLIDFIGLSTHYISAVRQAADHPDIDVIHPLINRSGMGILDGSADEMAAAIAYAAERDKGIYGMKALAGGNLIKQARDSFRYILGLNGMHALAVGMLSKAEIDGNLALICCDDVDPELWGELEKRERKIQIMEQFCKGCGACVPACTNHGIYLDGGKAKIKREDCILCGYCAAACPEFIIRVV